MATAFHLLLLKNAASSSMNAVMDKLPARLATEVPGIRIDSVSTTAEARALIGEVDAIYGMVPPDLFSEASNLRWIQCPQAGPDPSFYHPGLVESDVIVTNMRGVYSDHISAHVMAWLLGFSRGMHIYTERQHQALWQTDAPTIFLPEATALIVGAGAIGAEVGRLCAEFGITVLGTDPRTSSPPPGFRDIYHPDELDNLLGEADFVVLTAPETPDTRGFFNSERFTRMKPNAYFINIGRGATVVLDDLDRALRSDQIAGAALDVFEIEPLPTDHPLWTAPNMLITPHVATRGPYLEDRWADVVVENCRRFAAGEELINVVDKKNWF
jgi:phosphoglycerate dehydrogenase-like enzyme